MDEYSITVIDDDQSDAKLLKRNLEKINGWAIDFEHCQTSGTFLENLEKNCPDVLFLDHKLNKENGFDILEKVRGKSGSLPIIYLTGFGDEEIASGAIQRGADDYIPKSKNSPGHLEESIQFSISNRQKKMIRRVRSQRDGLTGLYDRQYVLNYMNEFFSKVTNPGQSAVLFVELQRLKAVEDVFGHTLGDKLLSSVGERINHKIDQDKKTISRWSGDEFVIFIEGVDGKEDVKTQAGELINLLQEPFTVEGQEFYLEVQMGIALFDNGDLDAEERIRQADLAMIDSKKNKNKTFEFFHEKFVAEKEKEFQLINDLKRAVKKDQLREQLQLFYQPQLSMNDYTLKGFEALVRWEHPNRGLLSPGEFLPLIEENRLMALLDQAVFISAIEQLRKWEVQGENFSLSINVSPRLFTKRGFHEFVTKTVDEYEVNPERIHLELTENVLFHTTEENLKTLRDFRHMGIKLTLDDFGKGFSSFKYLNDFPLDVVKIDRSIVLNIDEDPDAAQLLESILKMCEGLGLTVVAEGVETDEHYKMVQQMNCPYIQGFYIAKPLSMDKIEDISWGSYIDEKTSETVSDI